MDESAITDPAQVAAAGGRLSRRLPATFRALAYRDYRLMWLGQLGSSSSQWMEQVIRPILILDLTGSALHLGLISAVRLVPQLLFGILAGAVADRFDRRRVLHACQVTTMAIHFVTALLIISGHITIWQVYATTVAAGAAMAFNQPARQALIPSIVPREALTNAIALNSVAMNTTRVLGPTLAGILILPLGIGGVFFLNGVLMGVVVVLTAMLAIRWTASPDRASSLWRTLTEGFAYVGKNRFVLANIVLALAIFVFGLPFQQVFVPLLAKDVLQIGNSGIGFLFSARGVGSLVGALAIASAGHLRHRGHLLVGSASVFGLTLIGFSLSTWLPILALPFVFVMLSGVLQTVFTSANQTFLLETAPPEMHGRVMSLMSLDRGMVSVGSILAGLLAVGLGAQWGLVLMGAMCVGTAVLVSLAFPSVRRYD